MRCPFCRVDNDRVIDSRSIDDGANIRRRRECLSCRRRFTTYERVERQALSVVKKGGVREPFDRDKIRSGLNVKPETKAWITKYIEDAGKLK